MNMALIGCKYDPSMYTWTVSRRLAVCARKSSYRLLPGASSYAHKAFMLLCIFTLFFYSLYIVLSRHKNYLQLTITAIIFYLLLFYIFIDNLDDNDNEIFHVTNKINMRIYFFLITDFICKVIYELMIK